MFILLFSFLNIVKQKKTMSQFKRKKTSVRGCKVLIFRDDESLILILTVFHVYFLE